jgi:hypothetical protein
MNTTSIAPRYAVTPYARRRARNLARVQGTFYAASGMWPLVCMKSFEAVTGPKADRWLVRTVSALLSVSGLAIWRAGKRGRLTPDMAALAAGTAGVLAAIDIAYVAKGRIRRVYLLDAAVELALLSAWGLALAPRRQRPLSR